MQWWFCGINHAVFVVPNKKPVTGLLMRLESNESEAKTDATDCEAENEAETDAEDVASRPCRRTSRT